MNKDDDAIDALSRLSASAIDGLLSSALAKGDARMADLTRKAMVRHDRQPHPQTAELAACGRLYARSEAVMDSCGMPTGRYHTQFTGDPAVTWAPFMSDGLACKINMDAGYTYETIRVKT